MRSPVRSLANENAGFGLGLRTPRYDDYLRECQLPDWLVFTHDDKRREGGKPLQMLNRPWPAMVA